MNAIQPLFVSAFMILTINTISAQYGGGYGNNGYGNSYGRSNQMNAATINQTRSTEKPKEIPVEKTVGEIMDRLKTELTLDELQVIAISNIMTEGVKKQEILNKKENSQEDKLKEMQALSESIDLQIMYLLYKNQKEKYAVLIEDRNKRMESLSERRH